MRIVGWAKRSVPTVPPQRGWMVGTAQGRLCPPYGATMDCCLKTESETSALLPLLPGRRRLCGLGVVAGGAAAEDHARGVAVEIVHGAADVAERPAAIVHQGAGALVEILGELADRLHRE